MRFFGFRERVDRRLYRRTGFTLVSLKYLVDALVIHLATGQFWTPIDYLLPFMSAPRLSAAAHPAWLSLVLMAWTVPFLWIGVSMTLRRAIDAGRSPWLCLTFFFPVLNYAVMLWLCTLPSSWDVRWSSDEIVPTEVARVRSAMLGILACVGIGTLTLLLLVFVLRQYGPGVFFGIPFLLGVVSAYIHNNGHPRSAGETIAVVALSLFMVAGSFILFALEGAVRLVMALPYALVPALLGGAVGRAVTLRGRRGLLGVAPPLFLFPLAAVLAPGLSSLPVREAVTAVEIDAPPARVWQHVVAFSPIDEAPRGLFRFGVAYPVGASIAGSGVGALRRCQFSTGAFVEPITAWEEPQRLAFAVIEQPPALQEWSPYRRVLAPHLQDTFSAVRGEFRLLSLPGGRTRLEGSTWYRLDMQPQAYWGPITDVILGRIHSRVLVHVKREAEAAAAEP